ncbi:MAG: IS1634 family transposase [Solobacterium sp.]|nr:IS1634 family transposase [Solobacterium sp.]
MAYFWKIQNQSNNTYLAIYESFYSPDSKGTRHRCFKSLGSISKLIASGIDDPISFYKAEVEKMNAERKPDAVKLISSSSPLKYLGYFPLKAILEKLEIKKFIDLFKLTTNYDFDLYQILSSLIFARCVNPCSKHKTFTEVLPSLCESYQFSYDQLLNGLSFFGNDYEKIIELFNMQVNKYYSFNTNITYFDCTNFYFEIDREDDFRKNGPSKENRNSPIIGLGLLLDANQLPLGMKLFPGNESEKPVIRNAVRGLKEKHEVQGRTIQVADKGLNCAANIFFARQNNDGYIFSKSVKQLPEKEKVWVLLKNDYREVKDNNGKTLYYWKECIDQFPYRYVDDTGKVHVFNLTEKRVVTYNPSLAAKKKYEINRLVEKAKKLSTSLTKKSEYGECSKYVSFKSTSKGKQTDDKVAAVINQEAIDKDLELAGYNLLVTSETKLKAVEIYDIYHNLWRIEESFRIMKSDLDARPVYLQKEETIKGHFLICYLTVLLERIFQFIILENKYSSSSILKFFKDFKIVENNKNYVNVTVGTDFIDQLSKITNLPLNHYTLSEKQLKKVLNFKI